MCVCDGYPAESVEEKSETPILVNGLCLSFHFKVMRTLRAGQLSPNVLLEGLCCSAASHSRSLVHRLWYVVRRSRKSERHSVIGFIGMAVTSVYLDI